MIQGTRGSWKAGGLAFALAFSLLLIGTTQMVEAEELGIANQSAFGNGLIDTVTLFSGQVNSFVPDGAKIGSANGRGVEVLGNFVYYTELTNGFGPTDFIRVAPFNNGAGGPDIKTFPNPVPGTGVVALAAANGLLYAMTGYPNGPLVVQATDGNGNNVGPPVTLHNLAGGILTDSDGFTVLPNGNWLINSGDADNSYSQFNPVTGAQIAGTTIQAHNAAGVCGSSTGVDNDGTMLVFDCNLNSLVGNTFAGAFIPGSSVSLLGGGYEDISLVQAGPINPPINPPGVPEPASLLLVGLGMIALAAWRRAI